MNRAKVGRRKHGGDDAAGLNPQQLKAATNTTGKVLVLAGAGSGKTKTLVHRASFLLRDGVPANSILMLTFTRKAADEMKGRITKLAGPKANNLSSGTFHSFCNAVLRRYADLLGIQRRFTILDTGDSADVLDLVRGQLGIANKPTKPFPRKDRLQKMVSASKNLVVPLEEVVDRDYPEYEECLDELLKVAKLYDRYKRQHHLYDYDDLIGETVRHLRGRTDFKKRLQDRYRTIMVDEYQDTNLPQKELVDLLAEEEACSLMVVGDDNQSIYSFRGANHKNILDFEDTYPGATLIRLEQNYRSTPKILNFVNEVSKNIAGYKKVLFSRNEEKGKKPRFLRFADGEEEAKFIAKKIIDFRGRQTQYKELAVLCRSSFISNDVQAAFLERQIPFHVFGGLKFIEKRHVKDMLAYMKVLWNPMDAISWHRILTLLEGVGKVTAHRITEEIQREAGDMASLKTLLGDHRNEHLKTLYKALKKANEATSLPLVFKGLEEYYVPILQGIEGDWRKRVEDFGVLKRLCKKHNNLEDFLSNLSLDPPSNSKELAAPSKATDDAVAVSTIHSAKGLEWNTVFVIGLLDGILPHHKSLGDPEQLEEERRLFYVACSRAKRNLYLTTPEYFRTYGLYFEDVSRFVGEVSQETLM